MTGGDYGGAIAKAFVAIFWMTLVGALVTGLGVPALLGWWLL